MTHQELIVNLGIEVNTVQDGDAFIREYTMNDAQLQALIDSTLEAKAVEVGGMRKAMPLHECTTTLCEHYPRTDSYNQGMDDAIALIRKP